MNRKIAKGLSMLLLAAALAVTQIPVSDVKATGPASDFQMEGNKLLKYAGTAEVVSVPDTVKEIGEEAFAGNDYLVKVTISGNVEKIDYRAFADCDSLRTVKVGDSVEEIATAAFSNNGLLRNVSLGASLKKVGSGIFAGCPQLSQLKLSPDNPYLSYDKGILYDDEEKVLYALMPNYEKVSLTLPSTVEEISAYAFWGNPYLENIILDSKLNNIPAYAFSNCINLRSVEIPLPIRSIEAKAFEDCVNLQRVVLPDSMAYIHTTAFDGCGRVTFDATKGTYSGNFADAFKIAEAERIENEDVEHSAVIPVYDVTKEEIKLSPSPEVSISPSPSSSPTPTPSPETPGAVLPVAPNTIEGSVSGRLLGQSSIVAGRAVVFIDNSRAYVSTGSSKIDLSEGKSGEEIPEEGGEIRVILSDNAQKGKDFPKYTIVNHKIASQAHYRDEELAAYEIEEDVTEIGDFAFARSGLQSAVIPEGVEKIGYGAFYHCDGLKNVSIASSVREIEANAFEETPWLNGLKNNASSQFVVVGDGLLLAYTGAASVINIPDSVKRIGAEVFKDYMGITAVNIPSSVIEIGEAAFSGCRNLKTINGGDSLQKISDRAFGQCPLSQIVIPASVREIGLGAYDCGSSTDTVIFKGTELPTLVIGESSGRLSNQEGRVCAFGSCKKAIVPAGCQKLEGTVLEDKNFGFRGIVTDEYGKLLADFSEEEKTASAEGIQVQLNSQVLLKAGKSVLANIPGSRDSYVLKISDSDEASEKIAAAYSELYGGKQPFGLLGFDISLYEDTGSIPITKLGKQYVTVQIPVPEGVLPERLQIVTLDCDGQLEAVEYHTLSQEDGEYIQFTARHFSPYGIYQREGLSSSASGKKDDTPDTGDKIHPKWFLAFGLLSVSVVLFLYKGKRKKIL